MALFKFRLPGQGEAAPEGRRRAGAATNVRKSQAAPTESVESLRQRARHRVIGASVLVVAAVIGFPMLFDSEPRPVDVDVPIVIPDRDHAPPLQVAADRSERVAAQDSLNDHEEVVSNDPAPVVPPVRSGTANAARTAVSPDAAQAERTRADQAAKDKAEQERAAKAAQEREARDKAAKDKAAKDKAAKEKAAKDKAEKDRADRADKLAQDKADREKREKAAKDKAAKEKAERLAKEKAEKADKDKSDTGRFVVQDGSFGEESKAREARSKLERAGIATYIQVIDTSEGKRTRVRVGPFGSRSEAEAAAKKVKALGLYSGTAEL